LNKTHKLNPNTAIKNEYLTHCPVSARAQHLLKTEAVFICLESLDSGTSLLAFSTSESRDHSIDQDRHQLEALT
jgi:hypothetical protein